MRCEIIYQIVNDLGTHYFKLSIFVQHSVLCKRNLSNQSVFLKLFLDAKISVAYYNEDSPQILILSQFCNVKTPVLCVAPDRISSLR